jgi:hypothetical protein
VGEDVWAQRDPIIDMIVEMEKRGMDTSGPRALLAIAEEIRQEQIERQLAELPQAVQQIEGDDRWAAFEAKVADDLAILEAWNASPLSAFVEVLRETGIEPLRAPSFDRERERMYYFLTGFVHGKSKTGRPSRAARARAAKLAANIRPVAEVMRDGKTPEAAIWWLVKTKKQHTAMAKRYHRAMDELARTVEQRSLIERLRAETETSYRTMLTDKPKDAG